MSDFNTLELALSTSSPSKKINPHHSSASDEWYTPAVLCEMIKRVLGNIDLDPASSPEANKYLQASRIITREQDGLDTPWEYDGIQKTHTVYLNPPGGKRGNKL